MFNTETFSHILGRLLRQLRCDEVLHFDEDLIMFHKNIIVQSLGHSI
jgi:hypothetical protein